MTKLDNKTHSSCSRCVDLLRVFIGLGPPKLKTDSDLSVTSLSSYDPT